jgi:hypothetical protein
LRQAAAKQKKLRRQSAMRRMSGLELQGSGEFNTEITGKLRG